MTIALVLEVDRSKRDESDLPFEAEASKLIVESMPSRWGKITQFVPTRDLLQDVGDVRPPGGGSGVSGLSSRKISYVALHPARVRPVGDNIVVIIRYSDGQI